MTIKKNRGNMFYQVSSRIDYILFFRTCNVMHTPGGIVLSKAISPQTLRLFLSYDVGV
jgi:hypothetical protein